MSDHGGSDRSPGATGEAKPADPADKPDDPGMINPDAPNPDAPNPDVPGTGEPDTPGGSAGPQGERGPAVDAVPAPDVGPQAPVGAAASEAAPAEPGEAVAPPAPAPPAEFAAPGSAPRVSDTQPDAGTVPRAAAPGSPASPPTPDLPPVAGVPGFAANAPVGPGIVPVTAPVPPVAADPQATPPGAFADAESSVAAAVQPDAASPVEGGEIDCPHCGEVTPADRSFCEACGESIASASGSATAASPCVSCGARPSEIDAEGYCNSCGHKQPAMRDHMETDLGAAAAVTDRGRRHRRNEDAFAVELLGAVPVLVVCDGVSTTADSDAASQAAADAALGVLVEAVDGGADLEGATVEAVAAAQRAVAAVPVPADAEASPSCTIVTAVAVPAEVGKPPTGGTPPPPAGDAVAAPAPPAGEVASGVAAIRLVVGWLGDSRGYWVDDRGGVTQLTSDHSWAKEQIDAGALGIDEAMADARAHSITRWLGADAVDVEPQVLTTEVSAGGRLLLCSDGLWNYVETEPEFVAKLADLAELVEPSEPGGSSEPRGPSALPPIDTARALCDFANAQGGHDNITVLIGQTPITSTEVPTPVQEPQ